MKINEMINYGRQALAKNNKEDAGLVSRILAEKVLRINRNEIIANGEKEVDEKAALEFAKYIDEIISGKPLQYITRSQEFMKLDFYVNENVLIPQPDTEILVEEVIKIIKENNFTKIVDMCSGSGCIGISIAKYVDNIDLSLVDIDRLALEVSRINSEKILPDRNVNFIESDMFEELEDEVDLIVSNPPYIETEVIKTLPQEVQNEPSLALDGGEDGLEYYKILIEESHKYLSDNGYLCMEIGYNQKEAVIKLLEESKNYKNIYAKQDLSGNDRIVIAQRGDI